MGTQRHIDIHIYIQVDPRDAPVEPASDGGIDWSAVQQQFVLFRKMALPYFQEVCVHVCVCVYLHICTFQNSKISAHSVQVT